ncbi:MAG: hypothetical protein EZS28_048556, partial [Streblomastix strix]
DPTITDEREVFIEVWDRDTLKPDDFIGRTKFPFLEYLNNQKTVNLKLEGEGKWQGKDAGDVVLTVLYTPEK